MNRTQGGLSFRGALEAEIRGAGAAPLGRRCVRLAAGGALRLPAQIALLSPAPAGGLSLPVSPAVRGALGRERSAHAVLSRSGFEGDRRLLSRQRREPRGLGRSRCGP